MKLQNRRNEWERQGPLEYVDLCFIVLCRDDRSVAARRDASGIRRSDGFSWCADVGSDDAPTLQMITSYGRAHTATALRALGSPLNSIRVRT